MSPQVAELERAVAAFRREHAAVYLKQLAGHAVDPTLDTRARRLLLGPALREHLHAARAAGELTDAHDGALCAQLARAALEHAYAPTRAASRTLAARAVSVEGDERPLGTLLHEWAVSAQPSLRGRLVQGAAPALEAHATALLEGRIEADRAVARLFAEIAPPRHPDAGPEGGVQDRAASFLAETQELTREALGVAARFVGARGDTGSDHLWVALGQPFHGLFPRDGRFRRLASDWTALGLRRLLSARGRAAIDHGGPAPAPHLVVLAAPNDVRVSASSAEHGLASELTAADAIGRALGVAHASAALPVSLRHASAGTVARTVGSLAVLRFGEPAFLRRMRGLSARESDAVARVARTFFLIDARLAAAAVLARPLHGPTAIDEAAALVERALLGPVPRGLSVLALRVSPGAPFRAKRLAPALAFALRERFDDDWYLNPRASEPLHGALLRAGELSVEHFAEELGADASRTIAKLSELF